MDSPNRISAGLREWQAEWSSRGEFAGVLFLVGFHVVIATIAVPLVFYSGYVLPHAFGLGATPSTPRRCRRPRGNSIDNARSFD